MYNKILVPLSGSKNDQVVLPHVVELANGRSAKVVLLRVSIPPEIMLISEDPDCIQYSHPDTEVQCLEYLKGIAASLESDGVHATLRVGCGTPEDVIRAAVKDVQPDVIVMSKRKGRHLLHSMRGCVADKILNNVRTPVLLIPAPE